jgi:hypothetical protein
MSLKFTGSGLCCQKRNLRFSGLFLTSVSVEIVWQLCLFIVAIVVNRVISCRIQGFEVLKTQVVEGFV